jgi:hypothetical protein
VTRIAVPFTRPGPRPWGDEGLATVLGVHCFWTLWWLVARAMLGTIHARGYDFGSRRGNVFDVNLSAVVSSVDDLWRRSLSTPPPITGGAVSVSLVLGDFGAMLTRPRHGGHGPRRRGCTPNWAATTRRWGCRSGSAKT